MDMLYLGDRPGLQGIGGNCKLLVWHADPIIIDLSLSIVP